MIRQQLNSGTMAGWTSYISAGDYTLKNDTELYLGYYQNLKGFYKFPKGTVIRSHGLNGLNAVGFGVSIITSEDNLQSILDNS